MLKAPGLAGAALLGGTALAGWLMNRGDKKTKLIDAPRPSGVNEDQVSARSNWYDNDAPLLTSRDSVGRNNA
jgi:hypothetical protein